MEVLNAPYDALNFTMVPCFWNLLEGETPPLPPFATALKGIAIFVICIELRVRIFYI